MGQNWRDSLTIGALMNTRGLMELVVLNIGYDLGILSPEVFSMMVIMALLTTFMTGPALDLIEKLFKEKAEIIREITGDAKFKIILSFGNPEMGRSLLRIASNLVKKQKENASITALHLCPNSVLNNYNIDEYENESFAPIIQESKLLNQNFTTLFKATDDIDNDIKERRFRITFNRYRTINFRRKSAGENTRIHYPYYQSRPANSESCR